MIHDDIVIGSGLAALATVMGLAASRRVLVIGGPRSGRFLHYDVHGRVPCAYLGDGGLGTAWHGVIPMALHHTLAPQTGELSEFLSYFYPSAAASARPGNSELLIPWRPIRPPAMLDDLAARRPDHLQRIEGLAIRFDSHPAGVEVETSMGRHLGHRLWIAAGALHTPGLLDRSLGMRVSRGSVSDHVLCYVGQVDGATAPSIRYCRDGMFVPSNSDGARTALYTLRPARFAFRRLDFGIEQRAAFGLPTGGAIAKIFRSMSAGLLTEALYNRFGLFASASRHSVYAQVEVPDAYTMQDGEDVKLVPDTSAIRARTDEARARSPFPGTIPSRRGELYIPGIHLHHSVDIGALQKAGLNVPGSRAQVIDASVLQGIGPEHHSFRMMLAAWRSARESC